MTADQTPGHDPQRASRDAQREQERAASRARQQAAYRQAQRASRRRALDAAGAADPGHAGPEGLPRRRALRPEQSQDRRPTELTAIELAEQRLEEAELQQALLAALAALPADERVAVVAALGYAGGSVGAAVELDVDPHAAEQLTQRGLEALRQALSPFVTGD